MSPVVQQRLASYKQPWQQLPCMKYDNTHLPHIQTLYNRKLDCIVSRMSSMLSNHGMQTSPPSQRFSCSQTGYDLRAKIGNQWNKHHYPRFRLLPSNRSQFGFTRTDQTWTSENCKSYREEDFLHLYVLKYAGRVYQYDH